MIPTDQADLLRDICNDKRGINLETLQQVILLSVEIAREGREGRKIGTISEGIDLPLGLGNRPMAAASITRQTNAIAVVVSESSVVRVFDDGEIISEIIPELWLLRRRGLLLKGPYSTRSDEQMTVASKKE